jgi:hypothetical protein
LRSLQHSTLVVVINPQGMNVPLTITFHFVSMESLHHFILIEEKSHRITNPPLRCRYSLKLSDENRSLNVVRWRFLALPPVVSWDLARVLLGGLRLSLSYIIQPARLVIFSAKHLTSALIHPRYPVLKNAEKHLKLD